jgi:hypothetical protein
VRDGKRLAQAPPIFHSRPEGYSTAHPVTAEELLGSNSVDNIFGSHNSIAAAAPVLRLGLCRQRRPTHVDSAAGLMSEMGHLQPSPGRASNRLATGMPPGCVKTITLKKCTKCNPSKRSRPPRCQHHQSLRQRNRIKILLVSRKASEFSHSLGVLRTFGRAGDVAGLALFDPSLPFDDQFCCDAQRS